MKNYKDMENLLIELKRRGKMYIQPYNYFSIMNYILGYDHHCIDIGENSAFDGFQEWLIVEIGHHCSIHWTRLIYDIYADENDELAIEKFFELYSNFLKICYDGKLKFIKEKAEKL